MYVEVWWEDLGVWRHTTAELVRLKANLLWMKVRVLLYSCPCFSGGLPASWGQQWQIIRSLHLKTGPTGWRSSANFDDLLLMHASSLACAFCSSSFTRGHTVGRNMRVEDTDISAAFLLSWCLICRHPLCCCYVDGSSLHWGAAMQPQYPHLVTPQWAVEHRWVSLMLGTTESTIDIEQMSTGAVWSESH